MNFIFCHHFYSGGSRILKLGGGGGRCGANCTACASPRGGYGRVRGAEFPPISRGTGGLPRKNFKLYLKKYAFF